LEFAADLSIPALFSVWAYTVYVGPGKNLRHFFLSFFAYLITVIVNIGLIGGSLVYTWPHFPIGLIVINFQGWSQITHFRIIQLLPD
jgi:hypothetical protein